MKSVHFARIFVLATAIVTLLPAVANGANILFFMGLASHSHRVALQPLAEKLAGTGHKVTFLTYMKSEKPHPNITEFFPEAATKLMSDQLDSLSMESINGRLKQKYFDPFIDPRKLWPLILSGVEMTLINSDFQNWLNTTHFDLIIYDSPMKEIAVGIAYKMKAKVILFQTTATQHMFDFDMFGLPSESSWLPDWTAGSEYPLVPHHFQYAYNALWWYYSYTWHYLPKLNEILAKLYGEDLPPIDELIRSKVDLVLVNEHFSSNFPRSLPPYVVPVGGMHCRESNGVLPDEMEAFLKSKDKFIFMSFGSAIKVSDLPKETQKMLFEAVESMTDTNVLWKWEGEIPENLPKNVFAKNWFPQQDVLAHPKCKGFLTQGGGMSFQQAAFHGVPVIVVPIWGDQTFVAQSAVYQGNGIHLELFDINKETLTTAFRELLDNEKYYKTAKEISKRFKERPLSAVDTAAWWTEYVLRHDMAHLKSPAIHQYWWQRRLLDFWATVFGVILITAFLTIKISVVLARNVRALAGTSHVEKTKLS
ncbi:unnamed protein product [Allacma fusca]|uniref:UDP-glucuronosyltransferase n=1 Tax=Allacma fusca TaxID=39272 RepID=A0A8J2KDU8_9HEXA|nr:unnamed protein product [Allacma fusca]